MIKIIGQLPENENTDYYDFEINSEKQPDGYSDGLWSDGKRLLLNPCYMEVNYEWAVLKRDLSPNSLRAILGFLRRMGCYDIPQMNEIPREPEESE